MFAQHSYKTSSTTYSSGAHHRRIKEYEQGADPLHTLEGAGEMALCCQGLRDSRDQETLGRDPNTSGLMF